MEIYCVISPDSRGLLEKLDLADDDKNHRWVMFDCDIQTPRGLQNVKEWLLDLRPTYVLIDLKSFSQKDCANEQELSRFLEERTIPTQFLLPEQLNWHNIKVLAASAQLHIHELTLDRLRGKELLDSIQGFIKVYHYPPAQRSYLAY